MSAPVISVAQMREWEKVTWATGQTEEAVMRRAGQAVARSAERLTRPNDLVLVLCGKGHNGDDARYAAEALAHREIHLIRVTDPEASAKEIAPILKRRPALIIDGLFGIGLNRPLAAPWIQLIEQINQRGSRILALDVPSGLNADTGEALDAAIRATHTLTLGAVKTGLVRPAAWPFVGRLEVAPDIGLAPYPFSTELNWVLADDFADLPPARTAASHKGSYGHLVILAGSLGYHGAAVLAARGAQRAQPGLITLLTSDAVYVPVAGQLQAVMVRPWSSGLQMPDSCTAVLLGPGLAAPDIPPGVRDTVRRLWMDSPLAVLVDASALDWLPAGAVAAKAPRVITPHPGEAARLLGATAREVQENRPDSLRKLSRRYGGCHVALKGHQTLTGVGTGDLFINSSGNPHLAQGGSGDLLAGYLAGLLAQPAWQADPARTLRFAVWQHGAAADALQAARSNWNVEDLAEALGNAR